MADRFTVFVGNTEIPLRRLHHKPAKLHEERVIQAKPFGKRLPFRLRGVLPDHIADRIADIAEHGKGNERNRQHHENGLQQPFDNKGNHDLSR